jgi:hypothetical protein
MDERSRRLLFRILPLVPAMLILSLVAVAAAASGIARGPEAGACEPRTWRDWHVAVKSQCVARTYVCRNMTPSRLLQDPEVAAAYEDALASNDRQRIAEIDGLVGQIREAYACGAAPKRLPQPATGHAPTESLPPWHPPVNGLAPRLETEPGLDRTI